MSFLKRLFGINKSGESPALSSPESLQKQVEDAAQQTLRQIHTGLDACLSLQRRADLLRETSEFRRHSAEWALRQTPCLEKAACQQLERALAAEQELGLLEPALAKANQQAKNLTDRLKQIGLQQSSLAQQIEALRASEASATMLEQLAEDSMSSDASNFARTASSVREEVRARLATAEARQELEGYLHPELQKLKQAT